MTTLAAQMITDLSTLFAVAEFAVTVTYNGAPIDAIVDYVKSPDEGGSSKYGALLTVKASDVPTPEYRVPVVIGATTWLTARPEDAKGDGVTWTIPLARDERAGLR